MSVRLEWMDALLSTPNDSEHGELDAYARAVAFVLYRHMNAGGQARPGIRTIAAQAGVALAVAVGRVKALEAAGWLSVTRRAGAVSLYQATRPGGTVTVPTVPPGGTPVEETALRGEPVVDDDRATGWNGSGKTVSPEPKTALPGETEPQEPLPTAARGSSTREPAAAHSRARRHRITRWDRYDWTRPLPEVDRITGDLVFDAMAARQLAVERQQERPDLPPPGSFREQRLLETLADDKRATYERRAREVREKHPDLRDPEAFIWKLDLNLALGDPMQRRRTERAEAAEAADRAAWEAQTPEDRADAASAREACLAAVTQARAVKAN